MVDVHIFKSSRKVESYDRKKLIRSIFNACLSVNSPDGEAEITALNVAKAVEQWLAKKTEVTSADIRRKAGEHLVAYNAEAAYMYKHKRVVA